MGTLKQDFQDWRKAKAEAEYCVNAMNTYQQSIEVKLPYEEWRRNLGRIELFCKMLKPYEKYVNDPNAHIKFQERYEALAKLLRSPACFVGCRQDVDIPALGKVGVDIEDSTVRCVNNRDNGDVTEHLCEGCDKFKELVKYRLLAANAKAAQERQNVAKMMLMNHFKIFKIK